MWGHAKRIAELRDEQENLRRKVEALAYDLKEMKERIQRQTWRERALNRAQANGPSAPEDAAENSPSATAPSTTDAVSAQLLARRRRRLPGQPPPTPATPSSDE